jgi:hypothetical protein
VFTWFPPQEGFRRIGSEEWLATEAHEEVVDATVFGLPHKRTGRQAHTLVE